ncbi:hypothetical protein F5Y17DRAFT_456176 [Xylariaceae sp. FL0594]|nr:hypothetical protein F5Y17DRAFT_456176 [Xylariaceae sp. FL0594]
MTTFVARPMMTTAAMMRSSTIIPTSTPRVARAYSTSPPPPPPRKAPNTTVKFWPFIAIIVVGTGAFAYVSQMRAGSGRAPIARNEIPNK